MNANEILAAIAENRLPAPVAHRALDLIVEQARRAGELSGFTAGQAATLTEIELQKRASEAFVAVLCGAALPPGTTDDTEDNR